MSSRENLTRGYSKEYTIHTIINIKSPEIIPNTIPFAAMGFFVRDSRTSSKYPWFTSHQCSSH